MISTISTIQNPLLLIRPQKYAQIPLRETDCIIPHMLLLPDRTYCVSEGVADSIRLFVPLDINDKIYPQNQDDENILIIFPGGIGDFLTARPAFKQLKQQGKNLIICSNLQDWEIVGDIIEGFLPYPPTIETITSFPCWISLDEHIRSDNSLGILEQRYAKALGIEELTFQKDLPGFDCMIPLANSLLGPYSPKLAFHLRTASIYKNPPAMFWGQLAILLASNNMHIYFVGTAKQDIKLTIKGEPAFPAFIHNLCGKLPSIKLLFAALSLMDMIIAPDSFALHVGGILGKPTIGLWGPTSPQMIMNYPSVVSIQGQKECAPCNEIGSPCINAYCKAFDAIDLSMILEIIEAQLN